MKPEKYYLYDTQSIPDSKKMHIAKNWMIEELLMLGVVGLLFCFETDERARRILLISGVLTLVYLNVIRYLRDKTGFFGNLVIVAGLVTVFYNIQEAGRGLLYFLNQWITLWDDAFDGTIDRFSIGTVGWFGRIQVILLLIGLMCILIEYCVANGKVLVVSILTIVFIIAGTMLGLNYEIWYVAAMIAGWILNWTVAVGGKRRSIKKTILGLLFIGILAGGAVGLMNYAGSQNIADLKYNITEELRIWRYGKDSLPQGDMTEADTMEGDADTQALHLTFTQPQKMYLKGFIGGTFEGTKWRTIPYTSYSDEETLMMHWVDGQQQKVSFQYAGFKRYASNGTASEMDSVTVENLGADRRYVYLPYTAQALLAGSAYENRDYQMKSEGLFGEAEYSFETIYEDLDASLMVDSTVDMEKSGAAQYAQWEQVYQSFVKNKYLDVSEEEKAKIQELFFGEADYSQQSVNQVTSQIRLILQSQAAYTEMPDTYYGEQDFIDWFLSENMQGNSAYFATIAALAFRTAGIPARYVEGYYLDATSAFGLSARGETDVTLTGRDSHAWVEVYIDTVGWVPVEVTPGFYYVEYTTQQIKDAPQSSVNIKNQTDEEQLQGSTTDRIDSSTSTEQEEEEEPLVQRVIYTLGILVFVLLLIWAFQGMLLIRYEIVRVHYRKKLKRADSQEGSRMLYHHVYRILQLENSELSEDFPYENIPWILQHYPEIQNFECERFVELLQKVVFGEMELTPAEYMTVQRFDERIAEEVYATLSPWKRFKGRYIRCLF